MRRKRESNLGTAGQTVCLYCSRMPGCSVLFFKACLLFAIFLTVPQLASGQIDPDGTFPPKIVIPIGPVQGAVAAASTNIYVSTQQGAIYLADIKSGDGKTLNSGGDGQTLGDLCLDSREAKTLYGTGRSTGLLYAFNEGGKLVRRFALTPESSDKERHYISSCVQSRYFLLVTDAFSNTFYKFDLADTGPERGQPPPLSGKMLQGTAVKFGGQWQPAKAGTLGAMSLEWSSRWNETAFVLNSDTGKIYSFPLKATGTASLRQMKVGGKQTVFPGAIKIMFDSTNEFVLYVLQPGRNAIAVIEVDPDDVTNAMYIRTLTSTLIDGPVGLSEFGDWLYVLNGKLSTLDTKKRVEESYDLVQIPRHVQQIKSDSDSTGPFTPVPDGDDPPQKEVYSRSEVQRVLTAGPVKTGKKPSSPLDEEYAPRSTPGGKSSSDSSDSEDDSDGDVFSGGRKDGSSDSDDDKACFPRDAVVRLASGRHALISDLRIGDKVLVGESQPSTSSAVSAGYSSVFLFSHRDRTVRTSFVSLHHELDNGKPLVVSPGHYVYANGHLKAASAVKIGDILQVAQDSTRTITNPRTGSRTSAPSNAAGYSVSCDPRENDILFARSRVTHVQKVSGQGLFNPQTLDGRIVVNNVVVSTYTTAVTPKLATALLSPFRFVANWGGPLWPLVAERLNLFSHGSTCMSSIVPRGPEEIQWQP